MKPFDRFIGCPAFVGDGAGEGNEHAGKTFTICQFEERVSF